MNQDLCLHEAINWVLAKISTISDLVIFYGKLFTSKPISVRNRWISRSFTHTGYRWNVINNSCIWDVFHKDEWEWDEVEVQLLDPNIDMWTMASGDIWNVKISTGYLCWIWPVVWDTHPSERFHFIWSYK